MARLAIVGVLSLIGAFITLLFQGIAAFMGPNAVYKTVRPVDFLNENIVAWVDGIQTEMVFQVVDFLITTPIYLIFGVVGVVLLIISSLKWKS